MLKHWYIQYYNIYTQSPSGGGKKLSSKRISSLHKQIIDYFVRNGWRREFVAKEIANIKTNDLFEYDSNKTVLEGSAMAWYYKYGDSELPLINNLINIGLRPEVASKLYTVVEPLINTCYIDIQLLYIIIEYILGKYNPIGDMYDSFLYNENIMNKWIDYEYLSNKITKIINIPYKCSEKLYNNVMPIVKLLPHSEDNSMYYYHATNWRSYKDIIRKIKHNKGKECLDFGKESGFYLANRLQISLDWGERIYEKCNREVAIIIFSLPNDLKMALTGSMNVKIIKDKDEWENITYSSRNCIDDDITDDIDNNYDFVYGDMVANPKSVENGYKPITHKPPKKQLVSKSYRADEYLQSRIVGCMFFDKQK